MIYFDNAATGGFKPPQSIDNAIYSLKYLNANAGRSGHKLAFLAAEKIYSARKALAEYFSAKSLGRVIFTLNCTDALNKAIFGSVKEKCHVVTTVTEHNSVLRPLYALKRAGKIDISFVSPEVSAVTVKDVETALRDDTALVVLNAVSNVTGMENDVRGIGKMLKKRNIRFIVDGAQAAGHKKISLDGDNIDALCVAGHKGLMSIQGVGALILNENIEISPTAFGGTGVDSFNEDMPDLYPERLEAGTMALPAIASLLGGIDYLNENATYSSDKVLALTEYLIEELALRPYLKIFSIPNRFGIVAFEHRDFPSQELSEILSDKYDIAVRGGFHCAPLMHKFLKTEKFGLVRVSLSAENDRRELKSLVRALDEISNF